MGLQLPTNALFGMAIQQGGGGQGLTDYVKTTLGYQHVVSKDDNFSFYSLTALGLSPVKQQQPLQQEIGGKALPAGVFTVGTWAAGMVSLVPRLDNRLGWLLLAAMGDVSTVANTKAENLAPLGGTHGSDAGIYSHIFWFRDDDQFFIPWVTVRRLLPHSTDANRIGETFQDGKVTTMTLTAAAGAAVTADMDFVARLKQINYVFDYNPSWADATITYDEYEKFAVTSCDGHFKVNSVAFDATAVSLTMANQPLAPAQSIVIGTTHPKDFPNLGRIANVAVTFLVDDYDFYVSTFKGTAASTDSNVECTVYQADLDVMLASQENITGSEPYRIRIFSNQDLDNAMWSVAPIRIRPNTPIVVQATCTLTAVSGSNWESHPLFVVLQNDKTSYALPTP